jgi:hypothetical protein
MPFGHGAFAEQSQAIKNYLAHLDSLGLSPPHRDGVKATKGLVLVWAAAVLEQFWKTYINELCHRYVSSPPRVRRRNLTAAGIFYFDSLAGLASAKSLKRWAKLADFFDDLAKQDASPVQAYPHDGRTVRPEHLELIWRIFSLPGDAFPSPIHRQELNTLADRRNDVAHGNVTPADMGGQVSVLDLRRTIARLEDTVEHCVLSATSKW